MATGGELHVALRAGLPARAHRVPRQQQVRATSCALALELGVGRIVADSLRRARPLEALVAAGLPRPRVLVRVTPGVEAHTHEYIATGADDSKFGFTVVERRRARDGGDCGSAKSDALDFAGFHCHIGSQILVLESYRASPPTIVADAGGRGRATRRGAQVDEINLGGGLGVAVHRRRPRRLPSIAEFAGVVRAAYATACARAGLDPVPRLTVEAGPLDRGAGGRHALHASARSRTIPGVRTYVAVDGGMSDNPRPATYGARVRGVPPRPGRRARRPCVATVAGKHCEQGDLLVRDAHLPGDVAVGDVLATPVDRRVRLLDGVELQPGAASRRWCSCATAPARVVVRRETLDDLVSRDVPERERD